MTLREAIELFPQLLDEYVLTGYLSPYEADFQFYRNGRTSRLATNEKAREWAILQLDKPLR